MDSDEKYNKLLQKYNHNSKSSMYIFETTKCCGYCELLYIHRNDSCLGLYRLLGIQMATNDIKEIYIQRDDGTKVIIPLSENMQLTDFINKEITQHGLRSIYGLNVPVVYKLYYDDGHCHSHYH